MAAPGGDQPGGRAVLARPEVHQGAGEAAGGDQWAGEGGWV